MEVVKAFSTNDLHTEIVIRGTPEKPLFRASDIGQVLDILSIRSVIREYTDEEKVALRMHTPGGEQDVTFLTSIGLYRILFTSKKPIAKQFQKWVFNVIEEIRLTGNYKLEQEIKEIKEEKAQIENKLTEINEEKQQLENKLTQVEEENKLLQIKETLPMIYIYNMDTRIEKSELKIGYTLNVQTRIRPYKQVCKFGKLEFSIEVMNQNVKTVENFIHHMLSSFQIRDEVFRIDVEEAKMIIMRIVNTMNLIQIPMDSDRQLKLSKIIECENQVIHNAPVNKISTCEVSTQTDFYENTMELRPNLLDNDEHSKKFDKFIEEHCILHSDAEVSVVDIIGQYRILQQSASKEVYNLLKIYLDTKFRQCRLKTQTKDSVINGYIGIKLKEIEYKKSLINNDEQDFIFHACAFSPSGKVLFADLMDEYYKWKKALQKEITPDDPDHMKKYLKSTKHTLYATIWATSGNGQGYYGLSLKIQLDKVRKTSSTGKQVEKRDSKTNQLLGIWETIAKAADSEKMCAAKMSRSIKTRTIFNDEYYYGIPPKN